MILVTVVTIVTSDSCDSSDNSGGFFCHNYFFLFLKIVTKKNLNCDKTHKHKLLRNSKTQTVTKINQIEKKKRQIVTKLKNPNCDLTQKLKL